MFLVMFVLILRLSITKKATGPDHLLSQGTIWNDNFNGPSSGQDFLGYTRLSDTGLENFRYCLDRDFGPDRTMIALASSGNHDYRN